MQLRCGQDEVGEPDDFADDVQRLTLGESCPSHFRLVDKRMSQPFC